MHRPFSPTDHRHLEAGRLELGLLKFVDDGPEITLVPRQDAAAPVPKRPAGRRAILLPIALGVSVAVGGAILQQTFAAAFAPEFTCAISYHHEPFYRPMPCLTP
jgi:hypothetical protein